jgi:hypothetical protein
METQLVQLAGMCPFTALQTGEEEKSAEKEAKRTVGATASLRLATMGIETWVGWMHGIWDTLCWLKRLWDGSCVYIGDLIFGYPYYHEGKCLSTAEDGF